MATCLHRREPCLAMAMLCMCVIIFRIHIYTYVQMYTHGGPVYIYTTRICIHKYINTWLASVHLNGINDIDQVCWKRKKILKKFKKHKKNNTKIKAQHIKSSAMSRNKNCIVYVQIKCILIIFFLPISRYFHALIREICKFKFTFNYNYFQQLVTINKKSYSLKSCRKKKKTNNNKLFIKARTVNG